MGSIRITSSKYAARHILLPVANRLMAENPGLNVEITVDNKLVDVVKDGFDAGIRLGEQVDKDMVAVRISPDVCMVIVGAPAYLAENPAPQVPHDLTDHTCINLRLPTLGGLYVWEFEKDGQAPNVRVNGQFACNDTELIVDAAVAGRGLACVTGDSVVAQLKDGSLVQVLADWCPSFPGYHLYYPSRRQQTPAFRLLVEAIRHRGP